MDAIAQRVTTIFTTVTLDAAQDVKRVIERNHVSLD